MSYILHTNIKAKSASYGKTRSASAIKYLVYHYTGNKTDTAVANAKYFRDKNTRSAGAHYFVDAKDVYQSIDDLRVAWAVGGAKYSNCNVTGGGTMYKKVTNTNSISIEMCSTNSSISEGTIENAIELGKKLMTKYNIPINNVYMHFDVNGKACPGWTGWCNNGRTKWINFKNKLSSISLHQTTLSSQITSSKSNTYTFKDFVKEVQIAIGTTSDGIPGLKTLAATPTVSRTKNNKHAVIKPLQKYLNSLGYNCGTADGIAGTKFNVAVKAFQKANGCVIDGELTAKGKSWKKILKLA